MFDILNEVACDLHLLLKLLLLLFDFPVLFAFILLPFLLVYAFRDLLQQTHHFHRLIAIMFVVVIVNVLHLAVKRQQTTLQVLFHFIQSVDFRVIVISCTFIWRRAVFVLENWTWCSSFNGAQAVKFLHTWEIEWKTLRKRFVWRTKVLFTILHYPVIPAAKAVHIIIVKILLLLGLLQNQQLLLSTELRNHFFKKERVGVLIHIHGVLLLADVLVQLLVNTLNQALLLLPVDVFGHVA